MRQRENPFLYAEKPRERNSGEIFCRHGRKMRRKMARIFADFRPLISWKRGRKTFHEKLATNSAGSEKQNSFTARLGSLGAQFLAPPLLAHGFVPKPPLFPGPLTVFRRGRAVFRGRGVGEDPQGVASQQRNKFLKKCRGKTCQENGPPQVQRPEMTIKIMFERSSQKGGRQGVRKEGQQGTHLEILLSG